MMALMALGSAFVAGAGVKLQRLGATEFGAAAIAIGAFALGACVTAIKGGAA
jgi:hypothetical protein